jgi:hypothetical protein
VHRNRQERLCIHTCVQETERYHTVKEVVKIHCSSTTQLFATADQLPSKVMIHDYLICFCFFCLSSVNSKVLSAQPIFKQAVDNGMLKIENSFKSPPHFSPAARKHLPLEMASDGLHWLLPARLGLSSSEFQALDLIIDTGSAELMLFNRSYCNEQPQTHHRGDCFNPSQSFSYTPTSSLSTFILLIDGEIVEAQPTQVSRDFFSLPLDVDGVFQQEIVEMFAGFHLTSDILFTTREIPLHSFPFCDGLLGFAHSELSRSTLGASPALSLLDLAGASEYSLRPFFSLDFNFPPATSSLDVGGINERYRDFLQWSAPKINMNYHWFDLYTLKICNVSLTDFLGTDAIPLAAFIDSGSSCLQLPAEIFDAMTSWLPVDCVSASWPDPITGLPVPDSSVVCFFDPSSYNNSVPLLPSIAFSLTRGGQELFIRVEDLLLPALPGETRWTDF